MFSSSSPSSLSGAIAENSPSNILSFYKLLYKQAEQSLSNNDKNPLISLSDPAITDSYIGAVIATAWGLPIQQFWEKQGELTTGRGLDVKPPNEFFNAPKIDDKKTIVSPNTEVLYSNAFLDLSNKVVAIRYPTPHAQEGIFTGIQVIDPYTNVQFSGGSADENQCKSNSHCITERTFYWAGASNDVINHALAIDPDAIALASPQAWVLGRINVDPYLKDPSKNDSKPTPYQDLMKNQPQPLAINKISRLNQEFQANTVYTGIPIHDYSTSQVQQKAKTAQQFFTQLSNAVYNNSYEGLPLVFYSGTNINGELKPTGTLYNQQNLFNALGSGTYSIGLTAQSNGNHYSFPDNQRRKIIKGHNDAISAIDLISSFNDPDIKDNYWTINTTLGQYKPDYSGWITAAAVADVGLGANLASDGTYPQTSTGIGKRPEDKEDLSSQHDYRITFTPEDAKLIPINQPGFWSITVYDNQNNLVKTDQNNLNSFYLINKFNPTTGVYSLGSNQFDYAENYGQDDLSITLASTSPGSDSNGQYWLPTPAESSGDDTFNVTLRLYNPTPSRDNGDEEVSVFSKDPSLRWTPPFVEKLVTTTNGPLQFGHVHLHRKGKIQDWNKLETVTTDQNGQYTQSSLAGQGTLIFRGGKDAITGQPYEGLLLADTESNVISPLSTIDWALQRNGLSEKTRDQIIDGLVNAVYEVLTGTVMNENARELNSVTDTAPHQVIRRSMKEAQDVAKSQVILNRALGEALTDLWQNNHERILLNVNPLHSYKASVVSFVREFENADNKKSTAFREADLALALNRIQPGSGDAVRSLMGIGAEMRDLDYYSFIELLAAEA